MKSDISLSILHQRGHICHISVQILHTLQREIPVMHQGHGCLLCQYHSIQ